jgi:hypothetical protein
MDLSTEKLLINSYKIQAAGIRVFISFFTPISKPVFQSYEQFLLTSKKH